MIPIPPSHRLLFLLLAAGARLVHAAGGAATPAGPAAVALAAPQCPQVSVPEAALRAGLHGTTQLRLLLNEQGGIDEAQVAHGSGHALLDEAARAMALACRFTPYMAQGKASRAWLLLPVAFQASRPTAVLANGKAPVQAAWLDVRHCARPDYPRAAQAQGAQGTTSLELLIGTDGVVQESRLARSSGYPQLDEAARAALGACRFAPALRDGAPVQQWASTSYVWRLDGG